MTFKQRNGYGLDELVQRSLARGDVRGMSGGDEHDTAVGQAFNEATGRSGEHEKHGMSDEHAVVLGSGNLGLVYLMEHRRRLSAEEIQERHPNLIPALSAHPHIGFLLMRSSQHGPIAVGSGGTHYLATGRIEGQDPLEPFSANAAAHLRRTDGFEHVADIMVNSFYDPDLEQGCAFEELISFHGGLGGPQTRPFILYPASCPFPTSRSSVPPACTRSSRAGAACSREDRTPWGKPPTMEAGQHRRSRRCGASGSFAVTVNGRVSRLATGVSGSDLTRLVPVLGRLPEGHVRLEHEVVQVG